MASSSTTPSASTKTPEFSRRQETPSRTTSSRILGFQSPIRFANRRSSTPMALVAPQMAVSSSSSRGGPQTRDSVASSFITTATTSTPSRFVFRSRRLNASPSDAVRSSNDFLISLRTPADEQHERPGLYGLTLSPVPSSPNGSGSGIYRRRDLSPRASTSETPLSASANRQILASEISDPRLPSVGHAAPTTRTVPLQRESPESQRGSTESVGGSSQQIPQISSGRAAEPATCGRSPTPEPTRQILAEHRELIANLQSNLVRLHGRIESVASSRETSRPVSPFAQLSSGFQSANSSGSALSLGYRNANGTQAASYPRNLGSVEGTEFFGMGGAGHSRSIGDEGRSVSAMALLEKDGHIARLNRRLERAQSELELAHLREECTEKELRHAKAESEVLKSKNDRLAKEKQAVSMDCEAKMRGQKEECAAVVRDLETAIGALEEKLQKAADADELRKELGWSRIQLEATEMALSAKETELYLMNEKKARVGTSGGMPVGKMDEIGRRLRNQRKEMAIITANLQAIMETTKTFKNKGKKIKHNDLDRMINDIMPIFEPEDPCGDVMKELEKNSAVLNQLGSAQKKLHAEALDYFLDRVTETISLK